MKRNSFAPQQFGKTGFGTAGLTAAIAGGLVAAVLGLAAPAQADLGHNTWINQMSQGPSGPPHVDTSVHQSR